MCAFCGVGHGLAGLLAEVLAICGAHRPMAQALLRGAGKAMRCRQPRIAVYPLTSAVFSSVGSQTHKIVSISRTRKDPSSGSVQYSLDVGDTVLPPGQATWYRYSVRCAELGQRWGVHWPCVTHGCTRAIYQAWVGVHVFAL